MGFGLRAEVVEQAPAPGVGARPTQPVGEVASETREIAYDAGKRPGRERRLVRPRLGRETAQDDIDAGRLVLAVPLCRQAAGEAEAARPGVGRHDPDDGAARP